MTSQAVLDQPVCITGKSITTLCNIQDLQTAVLSEANIQKGFNLASMGQLKLYLLLIMVMFSISVALERILLWLYSIFTSIKTAPV